MDLFKLPIAITAIFLASMAIKASDGTPSYVIPLTSNEDSGTSSEDPGNIYDPPIRHRMPSKHIDCIIDPNGINSSSFDSNYITLFEIYDSNGEQVEVFSDEHGFITFLFSLSGQFEIRLHFDEYVLHGYVYL